MDITALIASDQVSPGDVLLLEEGVYFQTVIINKNYIRILAKGNSVVFDGKSTLITAFMLSNVTGVEIDGITIRYYRGNGIVIDSGNGNRIVKNKIYNTFNNGIFLETSSANLIWNNEIYNANFGMLFTQGSANNRIIENKVKDCLMDGFATFDDRDSNNVFVSNTAIRNELNGFYLVSNNNLLLDNFIVNNATGGIDMTQGNNSIAIGNIIKGTKFNAWFVFNYSNLFAGENIIECNSQDGILVLGQNGTFQNNEIAYNGDTGITFETTSFGNLVLNNKLICNIPNNIINRGIDNVLIDNIDKLCEPCETPDDNCDRCLSDVKNIE
jgi:parallel beta-helix repeat protein